MRKLWSMSAFLAVATALLMFATTQRAHAGEGDADGDVTTSVDVIADPGACILLSTSIVSYGELTFSTQNAAQSGNSSVTVTSCSLTTDLDVLAKGTDATGPTAAWTLTSPPNSNNMCDTGNDGVDEFSQRARGVALSLTNQLIANGLSEGGGLVTDLALGMPCIGSSGTGETVSSSITFTAIPSAVAVDLDGDGFEAAVDCDDANPQVYPGATEVLNGIDDDCDGIADEDLLVDNDADGFFTPDDCDDTNEAVHPGATEVLNGIDDDCDGIADEDLLLDNDADGFVLPQDCDDTSADSFPGATEIVGDGFDNNCDGAGDAGSTNDNDADTFPASQDCNDNNAMIHPAAPEVIGDRVDNDCDGQADET